MHALRFSALLILLPTLFFALACSSQRTATDNSLKDTSFKDQVQKALEQADLKDVTVSEDRDRNTITLGGKLHSEEAKIQAGKVAQSAASNRVIANEISVQPVGSESQARDVASNLDDGIENNYKAELISKRLDKQHIRFDAKNGVLTLKGSVQSDAQRQEAQTLAHNTPNVRQVVNQIDVKR
jgi:Predicted periplasmic or secreted lipoprotein